MQLLIVDPTYSDWPGTREEFLSVLRKELDSFDQSYKLEDSDIGPGADWPMVLAIFGAVGSAFFLGKKIDENLDAWISIAKKLHALLSALHQRFGTTRIDETGATLLAINHIAQEQGQIVSLTKRAESTVVITPFSNRDPQRLDSRVDALYVIALEVNDSLIYVFGIKSQGTIEFVHKYGADYISFTEKQ